MPVIQQERGVKRVAGLPDRWGRRAYKELSAILKKHGANSDEYRALADMLDAITSGPVPVDATDAHLCVLAERYAADCAVVPLAESASFWPMPIDAAAPGDGIGPRQYQEGAHQDETARARLEAICRLRGVEPPGEEDDDQAVRRMLDPTWWRARLRRFHGRALEHAAMRLGFVSVKTGSYCSDETVKRRGQQIERNNAALKATMIRNDQGQEFNLYDLAQKGMSNKSNRKGELMLRMAGCEEVAEEMGHVGLFVTLTCPSKYHAVLERTGTVNPKYEGARPDEAQRYLNGVWARTRAQNARDGIAPYGFRIAEPHHDGCPHWHMLVFLPADQVERFCRNLEVYACAEDAYELARNWHARQARLKVIQIDPSKGTAAGYIAKYVGKNIDDSQGAAFDDEGVVDSATPACARVDAWASVWGIRQFQGLGMPPVTVWRESRRVKEDREEAPEYVQRLLTASRRIEGQGPTVDGKPLVLKPADFAEYIRAQGGIHLGRGYLVRIAHKVDEAPGRYGVIERETPVGIYGVTDPAVLCKSNRYEWTRAGRKGSRSPLNNCTQHEAAVADSPDIGPNKLVWWAEEGEPMPEFDDEGWWESEEFANYSVDAMSAALDMLDAEGAAVESRAKTVWTRPGYAARRPDLCEGWNA